MAMQFIDAGRIRRGLDFPGLIAHLRAAHRQPPPAVDRVLMQNRSAAGTDNAMLVLSLIHI